MPTPKPLPTAIKRLRGNPGKRRLPPNEPLPAPAGEPKPPAHLAKEAKAEWRYITAELRALGLISKIDVGLLEGWCVARGDFIQACRALKREGLIVERSGEPPRRNPWLMVKSKAVEQMVRIGSEFGLSPASRPRIGRAPLIPPGDGDNGNRIPPAEGDALDRHLASRPKLVH